jgi:hypothetical protein
VANGEVLCESFKAKRSKDYFDKKRTGSLQGSSSDLAGLASADSNTNLSSLGGSTADLAALDISDSADAGARGSASKAGGRKPPKAPKAKK